MLAGSGIFAGLTGLPATAEGQADCPADSVCSWAEGNYAGARQDYGADAVNKCSDGAFGSVKNNFKQDSQVSLLVYSDAACAGEAADSIPPGGFARGSRAGKSLKLQQNADGSSSSGDAGQPSEGQEPLFPGLPALP
jgi:hypothetical protein